jgi:hypothetical protein
LGREPLLGALRRATTYRRFTASGVRAILEAGAGVPHRPHRPPVAPPGGHQLTLDLPGFPAVPERPLSAYALDALAHHPHGAAHAAAAHAAAAHAAAAHAAAAHAAAARAAAQGARP